MSTPLWSIFRTSFLSLFWLVFCSAAEMPAAKAGGEGIAGTWWEETGEGGYFVSFLPQGEFRFYMVLREPPFELPPDLMSRGKWRLQGGTVVLTEMTHEKATEGPPESVGRVELRGDTVVLTDVATGETMRGRRSTWVSDPIPSTAVRRGYYETVAGPARLELKPEKLEGRPGERIPVRVTLTNSDARPMYVPIRLADRVELWGDPIPDPADTRIRFHLDRGAGPEVPPRILSIPLAPGGAVSFVCTLVVPEEAGQWRLTARVPNNPRVPPSEMVFRVLPAASP